MSRRFVVIIRDLERLDNGELTVHEDEHSFISRPDAEAFCRKARKEDSYIDMELVVRA